MVIEIPLTQGKVAIIDEADWDLVRWHKWCARKDRNTFYAQASVRRADGTLTKVQMHRLLLGMTDPKIQCDHLDGDGLNNRRANLRTCTHTQNMWNTRIRADNTSGRKGVSWHKQHGIWRAQIQVSGRPKHLGYFPTPEAAYAAYCAAAAELHGEFANFG